MQALRDLAARQTNDPVTPLLVAAISNPPDSAVYVMNGQPVIVGWGRDGAQPPAAQPPAAQPPVAPPPGVAAAAAAAGTAASAVAVAPSRRGWLLALLALLLVVAGLLWWLWPLSWLGGHSGAGFNAGAGGDRMAALQAEEAALTAEIAAAEDELRRRLAACTTAAAPTPPPNLPPAPNLTADPTPAVAADGTPGRAVPGPETVPPEDKPAPLSKPGPAKPSPTNPGPAKSGPAKPQQAKAEPPPSATPASCPPPRKKWEAPELVLLLDASGSMRLRAGVTQEEIVALVQRARMGDRSAVAQLRALDGGGGNDRLTAAKGAVHRLLDTLPGDMDVGLVVFGQCQGADNHKFFSPAERPRLAGLVDSIQPMDGTPLARGLERAGNLVDGRSVPATLVVVTDGEDSCGGDPCATARRLKAAKPQITINVVDVNGMGEGNCMAQATGGKVLVMKSAAELPELVRRASGQASVPPGCQ